MRTLQFRYSKATGMDRHIKIDRITAEEVSASFNGIPTAPTPLPFRRLLTKRSSEYVQRVSVILNDSGYWLKVENLHSCEEIWVAVSNVELLFRDDELDAQVVFDDVEFRDDRTQVEED